MSIFGKGRKVQTEGNGSGGFAITVTDKDGNVVDELNSRSRPSSDTVAMFLKDNDVASDTINVHRDLNRIEEENKPYPPESPRTRRHH